MRYRKFGTTDLEVSAVGFGAWAIGGGAMVGDTAIGWGAADDATSTAAIHAALDAGISFFDTADIYGLGHSERLLGTCLGNRKDVVIATKVGNTARDNQFTVDYSGPYITAACEASLRRLQRDTIDYYQLHSARVSHLQREDCIATLQRLQQQGKVRYWGISLNTFDPQPEADFFFQQQVGDGFQLVVNLINQRALPLVKAAAGKGYGIIARMPLQFGLLTGKFDAFTRFRKNDHRYNRLPPDIIAQARELLQPAWDLCGKYGISKTALALSFVLGYPGVSTVIPGIRTPGQVADNTTGLVQLEAGDLQLLEALYATSWANFLQVLERQG